jgi:glycerophosphoryl diester phosphodiesterase
MPTLDEVFQMAKSSPVEFNIETKISPDKPQLAPSPEEFVKLVLEIVRKHNLEDRVILQSFDYRTLHAVKAIAPQIRKSALVGMNLKSFTTIAKKADANIVSPHYMLITKGKVAEAHASGLQVIPWTPNRPSEWRKLIDDGVDAIITDDPAALIEFLKNRE